MAVLIVRESSDALRLGGGLVGLSRGGESVPRSREEVVVARGGEGTEIEVPDAGFRCERAVYRGVYGEVHPDLPLWGICLFGACDLRFCAPPRIRTENRRIKRIRG